MEHNSLTNGLGIEGVIDKRVHSIEELRDEYPDWDTMSQSERLAATRDVAPIEEERVYNVTTTGLHEYFVDNLDPDNSATEANVSVTWMALGDNASGGTTVGDTDLNNRVYSEQVTDHADNGNELLASTFVDSTEANGSTIDEIGLFTGDPANLANAEVFLVNHSTFGSITKDNSKTVTFDVTLQFSDV